MSKRYTKKHNISSNSIKTVCMKFTVKNQSWTDNTMDKAKVLWENKFRIYATE